MKRISKRVAHPTPETASKISDRDVAHARETWKRDAPPSMRALLDAREAPKKKR